MENLNYFQIGDEEADYLRVEVLGYEASPLQSIKGRMKAVIRIRTGGFWGNYKARMSTHELRSFRNGLERIYTNHSGTTHYYSARKNLEMRVIAHDDKYKVECTARDELTKNRKLQFELKITRKDIPRLILQLDRIAGLIPSELPSGSSFSPLGV